MRGGANTGSIFDYQQNKEGWIHPDYIPRDPLWRPLDLNEAPLTSGEIGAIDCSLDYYGQGEPYYWRKNTNAQQVGTSNGG